MMDGRNGTGMSDLIDRHKAIEAFRPYAEYESNRSNADWVSRIELVLSELPSAEPNHWIFCKDQMPEMHKEVLVYYAPLLYYGENVITVGWWNGDDTWAVYNGISNVPNKNIIAWIPLPSPPNE